MSHDSEIAEWGRARREERRSERDARDQVNRAAIKASGIPYVDKGTMLMIRETGKAGIDFYPGTGRWRVVAGGGRPTFSGGAEKFIAWYRRACSVCGCTEVSACARGCSWVGPNLCSRCIGKPVPVDCSNCKGSGIEPDAGTDSNPEPACHVCRGEGVE